MSKQENFLSAIASALRGSSGTSEPIQAAQFATKIQQLKRYRWADSAPTYCEPRALEAVDVAKKLLDRPSLRPEICLFRRRNVSRRRAPQQCVRAGAD